MAALAVQDGSVGFAAAAGTAAAGGGDTVTPGGVSAGGWHLPVVLLVRNADATPTNVTVGGLAAVAVPATTGVAVIPIIGNPVGPVAISYSKVTSLTVTAIRLTSPLA